MTPGKIIGSESPSLSSPTSPPRRRALLTQTLPTPRPGWRGWESPCPRRRKWKVKLWERAPGVARSPDRGWETGGRADLGPIPDPQPHPPWELWFLPSVSGNCACKYFSLDSSAFSKPLNSNVLNYRELRTQLAALKVTLKSLQAKEFGVPRNTVSLITILLGTVSLLKCFLWLHLFWYSQNTTKQPGGAGITRPSLQMKKQKLREFALHRVPQ